MAEKTEKHPGGRPIKYKNPHDLQKKIDEYFERGFTKKTVIIKDSVVEIPIVTITGLILYCGFCDRASFYDYEKRPKFSNTIKAARMRVESHYETLLQTQGGAAVIFALKNMGWKDENSVKQTVEGKIDLNAKIMVVPEFKDNSGLIPNFGGADSGTKGTTEEK